MQAVKAAANKSIPLMIDAWFEREGNTFAVDRLGTRIIFTRDHRNVQAVLTTKFKDFSVSLDRKAHQALLGTEGIFTQDGAAWARSRALLKPSFTRTQIADLGALESQLDILIMHLKRTTAANPGQPVDLQPLFLNLTMDISTHFLLGKSVGALRRFTTTTTTTKEDSSRDREKDGGFSSAFNIALEYAPIRTILGDFYWLFSPPRFLRACRAVHDFVGQYAQTALNTSQKKDEEEGGEEGRQVFLQALAAETQDPVVIKDQVLSVLLAGRDSTAASLAWTFHSLARHPEVLRRLRQEILECTSGGPPAAEELGDMKYLRWTLNEVLRLYPPIPFNGRTALRATTIPSGGGPHGDQPIAVREGDKVLWSVFSLHRRTDLYGADAGLFRPERWEARTLGADWIPFNSGPRTCLGQQMALLQLSYVVVRLLQEFEAIEAVDTKPVVAYGTNLVLTPVDGVHVRLS